MRILWIKMGGLWPLTSGGRIRSFQIVSELSQMHAVSVLTTCDPGGPVPALRAALPHCQQITAVPHSAPRAGTLRFGIALARSWLSSLPVDLIRWRSEPVRRAADDALRSGAFDVCIADFLAAVPNLPARVDTPLVLFEHNVEHLIWRRLALTLPTWRRALVEVEWRKLRRFEARACSRSTLTISVSQPDAQALHVIAPSVEIQPVSTGVDTSYYTPQGSEEIPGRLAFVGSMDWYPNDDAALYLIERIIPMIRDADPGVTLTIVGRNPSARVRSAAAKIGAEVTGTVGDVRPHVAEAQVLVVPLRVGSGTRLKIFEGLAMGKAVVSTSIGAEGLPITPGEHYLKEDDPAGFAHAVTSLLADPARRQALGTAGRRFVAARYSWSQVAQEFAGLCAQAKARAYRI